MELLYKNRSEEDKQFITKVCNETLAISLENKEFSTNFCAIFVDGRNREINTLEDYAAIHSFKAFSEQNYPIFIFSNNITNYFPQNYNVTFIQIPQINNLDEYSKFCINELYYKLPLSAENCLLLQPDGFLIKSGWEKYINDNNFDMIGASWRHNASLDVKLKEGKFAQIKNSFTDMCSAGFSFRKASKMRLISKNLKAFTLKEHGAEEGHLPEDLAFCSIGFNSGILKKPTRQQCDLFSIDPMDEIDYNNKVSYGFHYFSSKNPWKSI